MKKIDLDYDEGIIAESEGVEWISDDVQYCYQITLTNKNIYLLYKKSNGLFSKSTDEMVVKPLADIKVINGQPMVSKVKNDNYGVCLQIQFLQGRDLFAFNENASRNSQKWANEIYKVVTGEESPNKDKGSFFDNFSNLDDLADIDFSTIGSGLGGLAAGLKSVAGSAAHKVASTAKQVADQAAVSYGNKMQQIQKEKKEQEEVQNQLEQTYLSAPSGGFCSNCGAKLEPGVKFCSNCGSPVNSSVSSNVPPIPATVQNPTTRQQEFAGSVLKCPNCGAVISQTTAVCPECGHHITGKSATTSVQAFSNQLMLLESRRKGPGLGQALGLTTNPVDSQKLSLIQSFPIPNTIDDIQEFMILAMSNIDVSLSKKSLWNSFDKVGNPADRNVAMARNISDAWVSKMKQAYQKASISFPNDPAFAYIRQLYIEKMADLKMKIDE